MPQLPNFWGSLPADQFYSSHGVANLHGSFPSPFGSLFTQSWLPLSSPPRGLVFFTHGYGSDTGWMFQTIPLAFARWNYAAFGADLLGHGRSDGLPGFVHDVQATASASLAFFQSVRDRPEYQGLPKFLFGESMGGGITFLMLLQDPHGWDGAIFSAPLLIMPEPMKPSWLHLTAYGLLWGLAESWAVMPQSNVKGKVFKDPAKAKIVMSNPRRYTGRARVGTMRQLSRMCDIFLKRCVEISVPFLVLHGTADNITAAEGSQMLYDKAKSADKTIRLYEGMYHSLIQAETDENSERVLSDIRVWLDQRSKNIITNGGST